MDTTQTVVVLLLQQWGMFDDVVAAVLYAVAMGVSKFQALFEGASAQADAIDVDQIHAYHSREVQAKSATERAWRFVQEMAKRDQKLAQRLEMIGPTLVDLVELMNFNNGNGGLKKGKWSLVWLVRQFDGIIPADTTPVDWAKFCYKRMAAVVLTYIHFRRLSLAGAALLQDFNSVFEADIKVWSKGQVGLWQSEQGEFFKLPGYLVNLYQVTRDQARVRSEATFWLELFAKARTLVPAARQELGRLMRSRGGHNRLILRDKQGRDVNVLMLRTDNPRVMGQVWGYDHDDCQLAHVVIVVSGSGNMAVGTRGDQKFDLAPVHRELTRQEPDLWHFLTWDTGHGLLNGNRARPKAPTSLTPTQVAELIAQHATLLPPAAQDA